MEGQFAMMPGERSMTSALRGTTGGLRAPLAVGLSLLLAVLVAVAAMASPVAHAASRRAASPLAGHHYKYNLSKIAYTGSKIVIAATDSHGDLYLFWQLVGSPKWHKELVAKGGRGHAYGKPSVAWTGHAVAIAAATSAGDLFYFAQRQGHSNWTHQRIGTAGGGRYGAPSISAVADGPVLISAARKSGKLVSFELASSSGWTKLTVASGNFGAPSIITCFDSLISQNLALISATSGGNLYFWWERLDHTGWNQEDVAKAGPEASFTSASLAATTSTILLAVGRTDGEVDVFTQQIGGSGWTGQSIAVFTGSGYRNPAVAWTGPVNSSSFDVISATTRSGGDLVYWWADDGSTSWTMETIATAGGHAEYANPAIAITAHSVVITAINGKPGDVDFWLQKFTTTVWHEQLVAKG
jgi:hypothetical protein